MIVRFQKHSVHSSTRSLCYVIGALFLLSTFLIACVIWQCFSFLFCSNLISMCYNLDSGDVSAIFDLFFSEIIRTFNLINKNSNTFFLSFLKRKIKFFSSKYNYFISELKLWNWLNSKILLWFITCWLQFCIEEESEDLPLVSKVISHEYITLNKEFLV